MHADLAAPMASCAVAVGHANRSDQEWMCCEEDAGFLGDRCEYTSELFERPRSDVLTRHQNSAVLRIVDAGKQILQRRLTDARSSHDAQKSRIRWRG